jgi:transposase InsO family protein
MVMKGVPEHLRSDNESEFAAKDLPKWPANTGAKTLYIEPGSPWENGYYESFNSKLRTSSSMENLLLDEKIVRGSRTLADPLPWHPTILLARLQITGTRR